MLTYGLSKFKFSNFRSYVQKVSLIFDPLINIDLGMTYVTKFLQEQQTTNVSLQDNPWRRPLLEEVCPDIAKNVKTILQVSVL